MEKFYFHLGYPRTATTFLQKYFFTNKKFFFNYGKPYTHVEYNFIIDEILYSIKNDSDEIFKDKVEKFKKMISTLSNYNIKKKINIISLEDFTNFKSGNIENIKQIKRIKVLFDDSYKVKIFFSIRKQDQIIRSNFLFSIVKIFNMNKNYLNFETFCNDLINKDKKVLRYLESLNFKILYDSLMEVYTKDDVKVLVYEKLASDSLDFIKELSEFFSIKLDEKEINDLNKKRENYKSSNINWVIYVFLNKNFLFSFKNFLKFTIRYDYKTFKRKLSVFFLFLKLKLYSLFSKNYLPILDEKNSLEILKIFNDSNKKLSDELNLNLEKYNYF